MSDDLPPLSPQSIKEQIAQAKALRASIAASNSKIAAALKRTDRLAKAANKALQAYGEAKDKERTARAVADRDRSRSETLAQRLAQGRDQMRQWAFTVYTEGGSYAEALAVFESLASGVEDASDRVGDLVYVTDERLRVTDHIRVLEVSQSEVTQRAVVAEEKAQKAADEARRLKKKAKEAVREHKQVLARLRKENRQQIAKAAPLYAMLVGLADPTAREAARSLRAALKEAGASLSDLAVKPCSDNTKAYPNGQVPPSALCPIVGSPGEFLRPDAAAAFNAMSRAYARETGHLLCVVDGYRSYAEQVILKAQKGRWAATPGRSQHGFGLAVDLCGGVENFGAPAHLWMQQNAPLFGWYHPAWAEPNGSLPEPWHWQYAG